MLPQVVKGDQKGARAPRGMTYIYILYSVRYFLKTAYVMVLPTRGRSDAEVFRIDFIIGGYWRTAREGRA
jgi:hypothetical protein